MWLSKLSNWRLRSSSSSDNACRLEAHRDDGAEPLLERIHRELPHLPEEAAQELAGILARLVAALGPERIYVFGSQARGTAGPNSDLDLMIVVPESDLPGHRRDQEAYRVAYPETVRCRLPVEILVFTREEFESRLPAVASLPATIVREGRILYAA